MVNCTTLRLLLALWLAVAIASCRTTGTAIHTTSQSSPSTNCRTIEHAVGDTEICGQPQKIVVLGPYVLEPLLALGVQPAAFADHMSVHQDEYDNPSQQIPYLGDRITQPLDNPGLAYSPSIEAILNVQPDLILGLESNNAEQYDTLAQIAPTLLFDHAEPEENLRIIAQAVNRTEQAEQLLTETEQNIAAARKAFAPLVASHPKMLLLSSSDLQEVYIGNSTYGLCSSLLEDLGFQLVMPSEFDDTESDLRVPVSIETLPQLNDADSIILLGSNFSELKQLNGTREFEDHQLANLKQAWEGNAIAQSLDASKAGRVYFIPAYLCLGLPGPTGTELYLNELQNQLNPAQ
ncbi:MAG: iron-siderophore ABC transporter substrate-binding protein [Thainema sp.]